MQGAAVSESALSTPSASAASGACAPDELTALEASRLSGVDLNYLYYKLRTGKLPGRKDEKTGEWRIPRQAVSA